MPWTIIGIGILAFLLVLALYILRAEPAILSVRHVVGQVEGDAKIRVKAALRWSRICGVLSASCGTITILSSILVLHLGWWWKPLFALVAWATWQLHRGFEGGMYRQLREARSFAIEPKAETHSQEWDVDSPPLFLYLRPFELDLNLEEYWTEFSDQGTLMTYGRHLEDLLEDACSKAARWVALGEPRAKLGIGMGSRNMSDEEWWKEFVHLASKASRIIIVPSYRGGSLKEIRWLVRNGKIGNCVFIRPMPSGEKVQHWPRTVKAMQRLGILLPLAGRWGLFTVNRQGKSGRVLPLRFQEAAEVRTQLDLLELLRSAEDATQGQSESPPFPLPTVRLCCPHVAQELFMIFVILCGLTATIYGLYSAITGSGFNFFTLLSLIVTLCAWLARRDVIRSVELGPAIRIRRAGYVQERPWEDLESIRRAGATLIFRFSNEEVDKLSFAKDDRDPLRVLLKAIGRPDLDLGVEKRNS